MGTGDEVWAIGDVTGIWSPTYLRKYHGEPRPPTSSAIRARPTTKRFRELCSPTPQVAAVGEAEGKPMTTVPMSQVPRMATYSRAYTDSLGFLTLISDGERLTGAYAFAPEAGGWLQQATLAIRARVPPGILNDTIQPFPTFSEIFLAGLEKLGAAVPAPE